MLSQYESTLFWDHIFTFSSFMIVPLYLMHPKSNICSGIHFNAKLNCKALYSQKKSQKLKEKQYALF